MRGQYLGFQCCLRDPASFRKPANTIGDRQPDHDHVYNQPENQVMKFVGTSGVKRRERQDDQVHYLFNCSAIEQATHQRVLPQKN